MIRFIFFAVLFCLAAELFSAYPSVSGCPTLSDNDFNVVTVIDNKSGGFNLSEPIQMAFDVNNQGDVDIFYTERRGTVKHYDGTSEVASTIYTFGPELSTDFEDGVTGIVLDPDFDNNGWIYIYYARKVGSWTFRVARFDFDGSQMSNETLVIDVPRADGTRLHTAGAMVFDSYGDLWFSVGDNAAGDQGPGCTADMRGAVNRIHPLPQGGYSIPEGNFGQYWAQKFEAAGKAGVAADYRNTSMVWPEVFVKGARNPYNIHVDPVDRWVSWADCGPDRGWVSEEHNMTSVPSFHGYPFFAGENLRFEGGGTEDEPSNPNCGASVLPPAVGGTHSYQQNCAMGSFLFKYDQSLTSTIQLPPNFHRKWFIGEFNSDWVSWATPTESMKTRNGMTFPEIEISAPERVFGNAILNNFLDLEIGPDGAMYFANYGNWFNPDINSNIIRIEYAGPPITQECINSALGADALKPGAGRISSRNGVLVTGNKILINASGSHKVKIADLKGVQVKSFKGENQAEYSLETGLEQGVYIVTTQTEKGTSSTRVTLF